MLFWLWFKYLYIVQSFFFCYLFVLIWSTRLLHSKFRIISFTNFNAQCLYSLKIHMLHYNPRHVSSINMLIFRRTNCIITPSGIVTLCKRLYSKPDESRLLCSLLSSGILYSRLTESDDTRCFDNTICPPEDEHVDARNVSRIVM